MIFLKKGTKILVNFKFLTQYQKFFDSVSSTDFSKVLTVEEVKKIEVKEKIENS